MGQVAVRIEGLTHGYGGDHLFEEADLTIEKGERVAIIGPNGGAAAFWLGGWASLVGAHTAGTCYSRICGAADPSTHAAPKKGLL